MVNRLHDLMNHIVTDPPPDQLDLVTIVRAARRRTRVRSVVVVGAAAVALAAVAVIPVVTDRGSSRVVPASPTAATYQLADAEDAVEGSDFEVLDELVLGDVSNGVRTEWRGVTEDGLILVERDGTDPDAVRLGLRDPSQGRTRWLPAPPGAIRDVVALDDTQLVFITGRTPRAEVMVYDRIGASWRSIDWPDLPALVHSPRLDSQGRLHVLAMHGSTGAVDVWSVSLDDPGDATIELTGVALADLSGDQLSWTTPDAPDALHTRDLTTGLEQVVDLSLDNGCRSTQLTRSVDRLLVLQTCPDGDQAVILGLDGARLATIRDPGLDGATLLDDVVLVSNDDNVDFVLDSAGRLRCLNEGTADDALGGPGSGDLALLTRSGVGQPVRQQLVDLS